MAKALFQRNQRVWVESVGVWGVVERLTPTWAKGFDEPVKITYDVGMGREFQGHELRAEESVNVGEDGANWRLLRAKNKWQQPSECQHHPFPGSYPIVVTDAQDWGGWRTPGAEYDRDPVKIERQARLITSAPALRTLARDLVALVAETPEDAPPAVLALARRAAAMERFIQEVPAPAEPALTAVHAAE
jgi:hypothetical protein